MFYIWSMAVVYGYSNFIYYNPKNELNIFFSPNYAIFQMKGRREFPDDVSGSGDVLSHLSKYRKYKANSLLKYWLLSNSQHIVLFFFIFMLFCLLPQINWIKIIISRLSDGDD